MQNGIDVRERKCRKQMKQLNFLKEEHKPRKLWFFGYVCRSFACRRAKIEMELDLANGFIAMLLLFFLFSNVFQSTNISLTFLFWLLLFVLLLCYYYYISLCLSVICPLSTLLHLFTSFQWSRCRQCGRTFSATKFTNIIAKKEIAAMWISLIYILSKYVSGVI